MRDVSFELARVAKKYAEHRDSKRVYSKQRDVILLTLNKKDFKEELSTSAGFGYQDLTDEPRELVRKLMAVYDDLQIKPVGPVSDRKIQVSIEVGPPPVVEAESELPE